MRRPTRIDARERTGESPTAPCALGTRQTRSERNAMTSADRQTKVQLADPTMLKWLSGSAMVFPSARIKFPLSVCICK